MCHFLFITGFLFSWIIAQQPNWISCRETKARFWSFLYCLWDGCCLDTESTPRKQDERAHFELCESGWATTFVRLHLPFCGWTVVDNMTTFPIPMWIAALWAPPQPQWWINCRLPSDLKDAKPCIHHSKQDLHLNTRAGKFLVTFSSVLELIVKLWLRGNVISFPWLSSKDCLLQILFGDKLLVVVLCNA